MAGTHWRRSRTFGIRATKINHFRQSTELNMFNFGDNVDGDKSNEPPATHWRQSRQSTKRRKLSTVSPTCRQFVESRLSLARSTCRGRHCRQSRTCSTRSTVESGLFLSPKFRPNIERPFDFVASAAVRTGHKKKRNIYSKF